jgi:hypothetical protein
MHAPTLARVVEDYLPFPKLLWTAAKTHELASHFRANDDGRDERCMQMMLNGAGYIQTTTNFQGKALTQFSTKSYNVT